jgi:hypothetical protein
VKSNANHDHDILEIPTNNLEPNINPITNQLSSIYEFRLQSPASFQVGRLQVLEPGWGLEFGAKPKRKTIKNHEKNHQKTMGIHGVERRIREKSSYWTICRWGSHVTISFFVQSYTYPYQPFTHVGMGVIFILILNMLECRP